ncbi:TlpA disulfide reductase family protein [uncultured Bacteroides sp.]|uniref:TlpA disulfide reductase family protein n=1 Tax=uncultured Bacteroides sp. TaxID=162156 RepID=UPI002AA5E43B|nr:TlpA disulfide reductase family protein [uncultured Bacteroides sp.]
MKKYSMFLLAALLLPATGNSQNHPLLKQGKWRAEFAAKEGKIPFVFEVNNEGTPEASVVTLINGTERVPLQGITYKQDSVFIPIQDYDTQLSGVLKGDTIEGVFKRLYADNDPGVPFKAVWGAAPRFATQGTAVAGADGKWDVTFVSEKGDEKNVGIFSRQGATLTGSILTNTGDLRFLEGVIDASGFRLSAFAGLSPYLIRAQFIDKDHFEGTFITSRGSQQIKGTRNNEAALADPYRLTQLREGYATLGFKLPDLQNKLVSLSDAKYRNKVVVVSILGSWCPNCLDEMSYLASWYKENKDRGVEIVGLAFERKNDPEYVHKVLSNLVKKHGATYDILFAGKIGDDKKVLPEIDGLKSYPTIIFIDKKGKVRKIHTGFNGPATGLFYEEFKTEFNKLIDDLLKEN